ncbi:MAG TPA: hypothetical protein ENK02_09480 [Planctomycetes bacterium]|nr:hypothetical protein [Planctomycetota bacterium]
MDPPGVWTAVLSVKGLSPRWGGKGGKDQVIGKYDANKQRFTPSLQALALNRVKDDDLLQMDPTGHYLVLDREEAFYFSSRTKTHLAFQLPVPIAGRVSTPSKKDFFFPSLGWVEGKLKLFWIEPGKGLWMTDLDLSNPKKPKIPSRTAWVRLTGPGNRSLAFALPVTGPDGDVEGFFMRDDTKSPWYENDVVFLEDLNPATPVLSMRVKPKPGIHFDPEGLKGGFFLGANLSCRKGPSCGQLQLGTSWLLGDVESVGGNLDLFAGIAREKGLGVMSVFGSLALTKGIRVPGFFGKFGLSFSPLIPLKFLWFLDASGTAQASLSVPNLSHLKGLRIPIQGLSFLRNQASFTFTNTAWLVLK